jgi:transketolase
VVMPNMSPALRQSCVNTIKMLSADAVEKAKSGHPGAPMGGADMAFVLWTQFLRFDPEAPDWANRDRFVLSNGHGSMLLYSLLHLTGYDLSLDDLKSFRQWGSRTPGHPEFGHTPGVEVTTGPLGQGFAHAVGMAMASQMLGARVNTPDFSPVDNYVYGICGDGDMMEGVTSEAASLAGHWGLGRLIFLYDANQISIEGDTDIAFTEDVGKRFEAYGWHVQKIDGHNHGQIANAIVNAQYESGRPSLIIARTTIGQGAPNKQGKETAHGAPLGTDELKLTKEALSWPQEPTFLIPDDVRKYFAGLKVTKQSEHRAWIERFHTWQDANPAKATLWEQHVNLLVPADLDTQLVKSVDGIASMATRKYSETVLQKAAELVPSLVGGSADLAESTFTIIKDGGHAGAHGTFGHFESSYAGRNFHFGVREHAMGSIVNGITLYGGFRGYGATFMIFSDYMRPPVRLASLMQVPSIFVFTHDSIFLGEDGPTHQPVEHLESLRAIPHMVLFRPADGVETAMAWAYALMQAKGPTIFALSRQNLPALQRPSGFEARDIWRGGYLLQEAANGKPVATLVATGSEVATALGAQQLLAAKSIQIRVVSMPSVELFYQQDQAYQESVVGGRDARIASVEAGRTTGWYRLIGRDGLAMGIDDFGASAPAGILAEKFGFTAQSVADRMEAWLSR